MIKDTHKNIIWDFNGTMLDDLDYSLVIVNDLVREWGVGPVDKETYLKKFTMPVVLFYQAIGMDVTEYNFKKLVEKWIPKYHNNFLSCPLQDRLRETLHKLRDVGRKQFVLSALQEDYLTKAMDHFELNEYFDDVMGVPGHEGISKVEEGFMLFERQKLNPKETLIIGDTTHDAEVAKEIGCDCLLLAHGHQGLSVLEGSGFPVAKNLKELWPIQ